MGRSPCCDKTKVKRGPWSQEEDAILRSFVQRFGNAGNWIALPQKAGLRRCGKSCRLRWLNYLRPEVRHGGFTDEEDSLILSLYGELGSKWSVIASRLPGRTDNDVKNYWNTKLKKRYLAATSDGRPPSPAPPQPSTPPAAPSGGDSSSEEDDEPLPPETPPAVANIDTTTLAVVDGDDDLLLKSEELYTELMGLIAQESSSSPTTTSVTTGPPQTTGETSSPSWGTSPTESSSGSCGVWAPVDVQVSESSSNSNSISSGASLFEYVVGDDAFFGAATMPEYSFQDLLAASYDEVTAVTQDLPYY
ncbi:hypothetical protein ACP4OV_024559 [Aristida adscensionis]